MTASVEQLSRFLQQQFQMSETEITTALNFQLHISIEEKDDRAIKEAIAYGANLSAKFQLYNDSEPMDAYERALKHGVRLSEHE